MSIPARIATLSDENITSEATKRMKAIAWPGDESAVSPGALGSMIAAAEIGMMMSQPRWV